MRRGREAEPKTDLRGLPPGFTNPEYIVQKESGTVLQVDAPAFEESLYSGVCPKRMDIWSERFENGSRVGRMWTRAASREFCRGGGAKFDGLNQAIIRGIIVWVIWRGECACDAFQNRLPGASSTDTNFAVSGENGAGRVIA